MSDVKNDIKNNTMVNTYRQQLMFLTKQKQQLQLQVNILDSTIKELKSSTEKRVYKGIGNVFIMTDKSKVLKSTDDAKETTSLKLKNIEKQEALILKKLNELGLKTENSTSKTENKENNVEGIA
jgi:prefoldin beta subunit